MTYLIHRIKIHCAGKPENIDVWKEIESLLFYIDSGRCIVCTIYNEIVKKKLPLPNSSRCTTLNKVFVDDGFIQFK